MPTDESPFSMPAPRRGRPQLVAHRGASRLRVENTLAAFAIALDQGTDAIELDVHATADGVVVVHHDPIPSASDAAGRAESRPIATLRYVELSTMRVRGEAIPTLRDTLALVAGRAIVYVEIKGAGIEQQVVETIRASRASCAIHSFDHAAIGRVRALAPDIPRGLLFEQGDASSMLEQMRAHDARDLWPQAALVDADLIDAAHAAGLRVVAWTVNDPMMAGRLAAAGIDALCTDDVPRTRSAIGGDRP
jgi:glycerophosphoryl diester phosphodiesterase